MQEDLKENFKASFDGSEPPHLSLPSDAIVAVVLCYNEAIRLPDFLRFHRAIGVDHFIIVDNASTDGTSDYLDNENDVTRIITAKPYKENKSHWRHVICDLFLDGHWTLFLDVDELFVYPGWPERDLHALTRHWDKEGNDGVFTTMIDMYPKGALDQIQFSAGDSMLDASPYFDPDGYRLIPMHPRMRSEYNTPPYALFGGARERLFYEGKKRRPGILDKLILKYFFHLRTKNKPGSVFASIQRKLLRIVQSSLPKFPPMMSKVALIKWRKGLRFAGGAHRIQQKLALADDWGALLHFKYLSDFSQKTEDAVQREQHASHSHHYKLYNDQKDEVMARGAYYEGSRRFNGVGDLEAFGLIRCSAATRKIRE
ncbi:glycosyltransferase family 2 protein [uncultured Roseibium sp.]|uniref:glycosyltransferase family 2 protein n=1 Tax=uncultured Roseibium sp. TaxID=1936171 RepID=UPI0032171F91